MRKEKVYKITKRTNENISFNCQLGENERKKKKIKMETAACLMTNREHITTNLMRSLLKFSHRNDHLIYLYNKKKQKINKIKYHILYSSNFL